MMTNVSFLYGLRMAHACFSLDVSITEAQELHEVQPRGTLLVIKLERKKLLRRRKPIYKASLFPDSIYVILKVNFNLV